MPLARPWRNSEKQKKTLNPNGMEGRLLCQSATISTHSSNLLLQLQRLRYFFFKIFYKFEMRASHSPDESAPLLDEPSNVLEVIWNKASSGVPPADELPPDAEGLPPHSDELDFLTPDDFRTLPALPLLLTTSDPELSRVFCLCWSRGLPPDVALLPLVEQTSSASQSLDPPALM